jgi:nickel superoxide dismutase
MLENLKSQIKAHFPAEHVDAHCDAPCGVYDPASARIATEAVVQLTKKIRALEPPSPNDAKAMAAYLNTMARYIQIKEEQAQIAKEEVQILWTDFFKPEHLETYPNLHDLIWKTTKLCSTAKREVNQEAADQLLANVHQIHDIFWEIKGRRVEWYTAS